MSHFREAAAARAADCGGHAAAAPEAVRNGGMDCSQDPFEQEQECSQHPFEQEQEQVERQAVAAAADESHYLFEA